ncbi:hypothetical protein EIP91_003451 [Steccherinum ochraceum]|uniref:Uncharacterized protein n=1 Tax=Steccherinum ochraceum TaxID=92696 RepID=A0A4R0RGU0_9APHY|nr:hypothetical protein EIP91_003451 [Steccherinum ochraceum]
MHDAWFWKYNFRNSETHLVYTGYAAALSRDHCLTAVLPDDGLSTDDALIQAIKASNFPLFTSLLEFGVDVNSNDYLHSRDGRLPTLPIHVAAANPDPRFLQVLIERGADPDDPRAYPLGVYPEFDNVFRTAVRCGLWENVDIIIDAGGYRGELDVDLMWELREHALKEDVGQVDDDLLRDELEAAIHCVMRMPIRELELLRPSDFVPLDHGRNDDLQWNSIASAGASSYEDIDMHHELTNFAWMVSAELSLCDEDRRISIIDRLLSRGVDVDCYTAPSYIDAWDRRVSQIRGAPEGHSSYNSPMPNLGTSYHSLTTPLHTCVLRENSRLFNHLVSKWRFNPNIPEYSTRAYPPLFLALSRSDLCMTSVILDAGGSIDFITPIMRVTALHVAAATHDADVFRWVVSKVNQLIPGRANTLFTQCTALGHAPFHVASSLSYLGTWDTSEVTDDASHIPEASNLLDPRLTFRETLLQFYTGLDRSTGDGPQSTS